MKVPTINQLFEAGVHFGHQVRRWHPTMEQYIYTSKNGIHIINLEKTAEKLEESTKHLHEIAKKGGKIIFVGTKKQSRDVIELEAKRCGAFYVNERWLGGTMTNLDIIKKSIKKLVDFKNGRETGEFDKYTKKERLMIDRAVAKLEKKVGGLVGLTQTPSALFIVDPKREKTAIREAKNLGIKVVALIDTNADVREIDFPIPGNDDAIKSVALIVKTVADAVEDGYNEYAKFLASEADEKEVAKKAASTAEAKKETTAKTATKPDTKTGTKTDAKKVEPVEAKKAEKPAEKKAEKAEPKKSKETKKETTKAADKKEAKTATKSKSKTAAKAEKVVSKSSKKEKK